MKIKQIQINKNKSAFFLAPLTLIPKNYFEKAINYFALNAHYPNLSNHVFVLFEKDLLEEFEISRLQTTNIFEKVEEYGEFLLFTFKLLPTFTKDYSLFLEGKYSKYSEKAKQVILKYIPTHVYDPIAKTKVLSNGFKVIYPQKQDRIQLEILLGVTLKEDAEIYSSPDLDIETFNINKYYDLFKQVPS